MRITSTGCFKNFINNIYKVQGILIRFNPFNYLSSLVLVLATFLLVTQSQKSGFCLFCFYLFPFLCLSTRSEISSRCLSIPIMSLLYTCCYKVEVLFNAELYFPNICFCSLLIPGLIHSNYFSKSE